MRKHSIKIPDITRVFWCSSLSTLWLLLTFLFEREKKLAIKKKKIFLSQFITQLKHIFGLLGTKELREREGKTLKRMINYFPWLSIDRVHKNPSVLVNKKDFFNIFLLSSSHLVVFRKSWEQSCVLYSNYVSSALQSSLGEYIPNIFSSSLPSILFNFFFFLFCCSFPFLNSI